MMDDRVRSWSCNPDMHASSVAIWKGGCQWSQQAGGLRPPGDQKKLLGAPGTPMLCPAPSMARDIRHQYTESGDERGGNFTAHADGRRGSSGTGMQVKKGSLQLNGREKITGGQFAGPACPHSFFEAMRAPSASERIFIQQKAGNTGPKPANVPNPQSVPAITRSRPTTFA